MNILVTGAAGFVGRNLVENLKNIRDGKNRTRPQLLIEDIYEYDCDNTFEELDQWCEKADFVFNLESVNEYNVDAPVLQFFTELIEDITDRLNYLSEDQDDVREECNGTNDFINASTEYADEELPFN